MSKLQFLNNRDWWRSTLVSLPWLGAAIFFAMFWLAGADMAKDSLIYSLFKVNIAVMLTWLADFSLNLGSPPQAAADKGVFWPQIRRAIYFLGVCWIMSIA